MEDHVEASTATDKLSQACFVDSFDFSPLVGGGDFSHLAVVVTPICDIAQKNADYLTLCAVFPINPWLQLQKPNARLNKLSDLMRGRMNRYHWAGKLPGKDDFFFIDYQVSISISKEIADTIKPFARATSPFGESIITGYARNFSRIGLRYEKTDYDSFTGAVMSIFEATQPSVGGAA